MITKDQAITERYFHFTHPTLCVVHTGPRGGKTCKIEIWRANGKCKTWKTRPDEFSLPLKRGMYEYSYLTNENAENFHLASDCLPYK